MKQLPIGIQNIQEIISKECVYIDKTGFAHQLITTGKHYFLSRPRRFGKSLFVDTLAEIFKGNKELFKDCAIYQTDYDWQEYPILSLSLAGIDSDEPQAFKKYLHTSINNLATLHSITLEDTSLSDRLRNLIITLAQKAPVVVLIDEYDHPIVSNLRRPEVAIQNREELKNLFTKLKELDKHIKFTFVTGISRFSKVSLFSGGNYLDDISMERTYAAMMGYTQEEIKIAFAAHIQAIAQERSSTEEAVLAELKHWYNGYRFTRSDARVYNPFSTLKYMKAGEISSYWYDTGTPTFLIEHIAQHPQDTVPLGGTTVTESQLKANSVVDDIDLAALMCQTGYLTIQEYDALSRQYTLGFPNQEVREAFTESLLRHFAPQMSNVSDDCAHALETLALTPFFEELTTLFNSLHYKLFRQAQEKTYQIMLMCMLKGMELNVAAEVPTNFGEIDILLRLPNTTYILELKLDKRPEEGLAQIHEKGYYRPYMNQGKEIVLVGLSFSSAKRNIDTWAGELLDETGKQIKVLLPETNQELNATS